MLGHLRISRCSIPDEVNQQYMRLYCSICKSLRTKYGIIFMPFINNEITFILLALREYYKPERKKTICPAKLGLNYKEAYTHHIFNSAATISICLGWLKITDLVTDNKSSIYKGILKFYQKKFYRTYEKLNDDTKEIFKHYIRLTAEDINDFPEIKANSNQLAQNICFLLGKDTNIQKESLIKLMHLFRLVGEVIAIADPLLDLQDDIVKKKFNPIIFNPENNNTKLYVEYEIIESDFFETLLKIKKWIKQNKNITNEWFIIAFEKGLNALEHRILKKKEQLIKFDETNNISNVGFTRKKLPEFRYVVMSCCFDDCCDDCFTDCCECGCCTCDHTCSCCD